LPATPRKSTDSDAVTKENERREAGKIDTSLARQLDDAEKEQTGSIIEVPKIRVTADNIGEYESGLLIFKLISGEFSRTNSYLEVVMDDMVFPSYASSKIASKKTEFGETGDAVVRELDFSRITLRLVEKQDKKGDGENENYLAKLQGDTRTVIEQCLVSI
jgi:Ca2+-dependent lipid-binding protein